ncbi:proton-conducting transporter transmembrane domain-containing protein [Pyrococcus yayanosii]|uniref:Formate hydrogenlyase II subunit D n=1 Tax=Pyrococcus yayanosii (strain CH1 / JCM 16557) TaxID=529709 RepID=F8AEV5_PYRYC|nr:proton-conducting transporter membrane subunit [Pyrococcus yayanosii]AEH24788.1 formate hydrogenlyase II subunit D [Pyrococcus yayanosii CH1]
MAELFTLMICLYAASMLAVLPIRNNYEKSIRVGHAFTTLASLALLAFVVEAVPTAIRGGAIDFTLAGIPFHVDGLSLVLCMVLGILGLATSLYSPRYMESYKKLGRGWVYVILYSTFVLSMILIVTVANLLWFVFFWEVMTLASYVLMIWEHNEGHVRKAGWKYFVTMHITSTLPLILALALLYAKTGSVEGLNFVSLSKLHLGAVYYLLFLMGFGSKAGVVPVHFWLPEAHPIAPSNVSALMSGAMIKVAVYGLVRLTCFVMKPNEIFGYIVGAIGAITLTVGTLYALKQTDAKRLLAYHSVGQMGYIWLGVGTGIFFLAKGGEWAAFGAIALAAGLYHLLNHAVFKGLLFLSAGSILYRTGSKDLNKLAGLAKLMPVTALFTFVAAMSIAGVPPFNGFMSKWMIYQATFLSRNVIIVIFGIFALFISSATLASFLKFYTTAFGGEPNELTKEAKEVPSEMLIAKGLLALLCLLFGLIPSSVVPLLVSPGKILSGSDISGWLTTTHSLIMIKAPGMPAGGETVFKPLLFVIVFGIAFTVLYVAFPIRKRIYKPWTLGEPIPMGAYKMKASNYYEPFEEYIHVLYHWGKELSKLGGRITDGVSYAYLWLCTKLHEIADATSRTITNAGLAYLRSARELYLDEFIFAPFVKILRGLGFVLGEIRVNASLTLALVTLAIILALVLL